MNDMTAIVCEYAEGTAACAKGAIGYYVGQDAKTGKISVLALSRSQRWVETDKDSEKLTTFRLRNLPGTHPLQSKAICKVRSVDTPKVQELQELAENLQRAHDERRQRSLQEE